MIVDCEHRMAADVVATKFLSRRSSCSREHCLKGICCMLLEVPSLHQILFPLHQILFQTNQLQLLSRICTVGDWYCTESWSTQKGELAGQLLTGQCSLISTKFLSRQSISSTRIAQSWIPSPNQLTDIYKNLSQQRSPIEIFGWFR